MKKTKILYWIFTIPFVALMGLGAIPDIINQPEAVELIHNHLGYPDYFLQFLGVAKLLGAIAILIPGFPRIKEWAYAGLTYDLIAALYSLIAIGDPPSQWIFMFIALGLAAGSYIFYHKLARETASKATYAVGV